MQNYTAKTLKPFTGLYSGFSCDLTHSTAHDTRPTQTDIIPPAPRWSVSQRRSASSTYQISPPRRTLYRPAQPLYYNKVYKGAAYRRPCKPGGVSVSTCTGSARRGLDASHARRLEVWHRVSGKPSTLHPAGQSSSGRRGAIDGYRRISFRAFAR